MYIYNGTFLASLIKISKRAGEINFNNILFNTLYKNIIILTQKEYKKLPVRHFTFMIPSLQNE